MADYKFTETSVKDNLVIYEIIRLNSSLGFYESIDKILLAAHNRQCKLTESEANKIGKEPCGMCRFGFSTLCNPIYTHLKYWHDQIAD